MSFLTESNNQHRNYNLQFASDWFNVKLLLNGLGVNGSTSYIDSSQYARVPNAVDALVTNDSANRFYSQTLAIKNAGSSVNGYYNSGFRLPEQFTIEFLIYLAAFPASPQYFLASDATRYFNINASGLLSTIGYGGLGSVNLTAGAWNSVAFVKVRTGLSLCFKNGAIQSSDLGFLTNNISNPLSVFGVPGRPDLPGFTGSIQCLRWSENIARYTANYAVSPVPFTIGA